MEQTSIIILKSTRPFVFFDINSKINMNDMLALFPPNQLIVEIFSQALYTGLVIYAPALALNQSKYVHGLLQQLGIKRCLCYC